MLQGLVLFGLSFLILIVIWWDHDDLMSKLPNDKPRIVVLNIALMFFVAVEPYLLNILDANITLFEYASILYAVDMTFLMSISAVLAHILITKYQRTLSIIQIEIYRTRRNFRILFASLFIISVFPQFSTWTFMDNPLTVHFWLATLILLILLRLRRKP